VKVYVKAALDEAVEQDFISKNPARKLELGETRETNKRNLTGDELCKLFNALTGEDHLILKLFVLTALRPGEEFALRWTDFDGDCLRIERAVKRVKKGKDKIGKPKTKKSIAKVFLPQSLQIELVHWRDVVQPKSSDAYIFPSRNGTPKDAHNYLRRHLKPLAEKLQVPGLTFQSLRRSFATLIQGKGTPKDVQTQMRHKDALMALNNYTQPIPESVKKSVEALDTELQMILDTIGQESKSSVQ
jgi:integrase